MITDYTTLQSAIAAWLIRTDLTGPIQTFIQNAESALRRDPRVRNLVANTLEVDQELEVLPDDFVSLESLYLNGPAFWGEIEIVSPGDLAEDNRRVGGAARVPRRAAFAADRILRFAPPPDQSFSMVLSYWATISRLSVSNPTNWLLDDHPDVYLYGSLVHSAPYLRDDPRVATWRTEYDRALEEFWQYTQRAHYSGDMVRRSNNPIP